MRYLWEKTINSPAKM